MRADAHPLLGGFLMSNERNYDTERLPDTNSSNLAENLDRRNFLKTAVVGSAAVAMTLAGTVGSAGAAENLHARVPAKDLPVDENIGDFEAVASFNQQVVGVAVSASGRAFVSFPRNGIDPVKISVAAVINAMRFDLSRGAAGFAYIADSSAAAGSGIIVVDLATGNAVRRLANDPTVLPDPAFRATVEGKPFVIQATANAAPSLVSVANDGIAVSADGKLVYYCPIASRNLYSVDAAVLTDFTQSDAAVAATIKNLGDKGEVGGLEADAQGRVYLTNGEFNAILRFDPSQGTADTFNPTFETVVHNRHLVWPDSLALGKDGTLYITSTQVNRLPVFNGGQH